MKHKCIISRLNEPHIARMYVLDFDQNLINNIRVLCTKSPETVRYFVPEELFLELRNGFPIPMTAECRDRKGKRLMPIDPLKVLSEQLRESPGAIPDPREIEIRIHVEGYALPLPGEGMGFLKRTPRREPWLAANKPSSGSSDEYRYSRAGREAAPDNAGQRTGRPGAKTPSGGSGYTSGTARSKGASHYYQGTFAGDSGYSRRPVRRSTVIAAAAVACLLFIAAGFWFMKDASTRRFEEVMRASKYSEAVMIYNTKILGHPSREAQADPKVEAAVSEIETGYLSETLSFEDAREDLYVLTGIGKSELSELAQSALDEIDMYELASDNYTNGVVAMEIGDYVDAIRSFSSLQAPYKDSEDRMALCVERLVKSCTGIRTEEEYPDAAAKIEEAIGILPENEQLLQALEACWSKYEQLVFNGAVDAADEMIAEEDYAGAFEVMAAAQEKLPESGRLGEKLAEYRQLYVSSVTRSVCGRVDEGDIEGALSLIYESQEIWECDEFDSLLSQVQAADDRSDLEPRVYTAEKAVETKYRGTVKKKGQKDEYRIKVDEGGPCRFQLSRVTNGLAVRMIIYASNGSEVYNSGVIVSGTIDASATGSTSGSRDASGGSGSDTSGSSSGADANTGATAGISTTCKLAQGQTYIVEVEAVEGKGGYLLTVREQKPAADITSYDEVRDKVEFAGQQIVYTFSPEQNGVYRFDIEGEAALFALKVDILDPLGAKTAGGVLSDGEGLTVRLETGGEYEIRAAQSKKAGDFTLRLGKPSATVDMTGENIAAGVITYTGQRNIYKYTAGTDGRMRFTIGNLPEDSRVEFGLYDPLGYKIGGEESMENGGAVTAELEAGQTYEIQVTQRSGRGEYTLTVCEDG